MQETHGNVDLANQKENNSYEMNAAWQHNFIVLFPFSAVNHQRVEKSLNTKSPDINTLML